MTMGFDPSNVEATGGNQQPTPLPYTNNWWNTTGGFPSTGYGLGSMYGTGGWGGSVSNLGQGFVGDPYGLWLAAQTGRMTDPQLRNPRLFANRGVGFTPTYGDFMMQGLPSWSDYLQNPAGAAVDTQGLARNPFVDPTRGFRTSPNQTVWEDAMMASQYLGAGPEDLNTLTERQLEVQGFLQGENARRNAVAMSLAAMGGGIGVGAGAKQRAISRLYDIYAAKADAGGTLPGGFLNWFGQRYKPTYQT